MSDRTAAVTPLEAPALNDLIQSQITGWLNWLSNGGVQGVVSETGWPNSCASPKDAAGWNQIAQNWLKTVTAAGVPPLTWGSGRVWTPSYTIACFTPETRLATVSTSQSNAQLLMRAVPFPSPWGTNVNGAENSSVQSVTGKLSPISGGGVFSCGNPGVAGVDYFYPTPGDFEYLALQGVAIVRLPVRWERLQPVLLGALSSDELGRLFGAISAADRFGIQVVPLIFNGAAYVKEGENKNTGVDERLRYAIGPLTCAHFTDLWTKLALAIRSRPSISSAIHAYGLMNEPNTMPEAQPSGPSLIINGSPVSKSVRPWQPFQSAISLNSGLRHEDSLSITVRGLGSLAGMDQSAIPVDGGAQYQVGAFAQAASAPRQWGTQVDWFDRTGEWISQSFGDWPMVSPSTWTPLAAVVTAPSGATSARLRFRTVTTVPTGEVHYISDITFEPVRQGLTGPQVWEALSQEAVSAIRETGDTHMVWVGGYNGQSPTSWVVDHVAGPWITDPTDRFSYDAHHYFDAESGGSGRYELSLAAEEEAASK